MSDGAWRSARAVHSAADHRRGSLSPSSTNITPRCRYAQLHVRTIIIIIIIIIIIYRVAKKIGSDQFLYALTLPNINRFSKLFHCKNHKKNLQ